MENRKKLILFCCVSVILFSCKKEFLEVKPSTNIVQPLTLEEFQKLLDNVNIINKSTALGALSADEYAYSSDAIWLSARTALARNTYIWANDLYEGENIDHWNAPYATIFYANNVLAGIENIEITNFNVKNWNNTKGWALFVRAFAYYDLVNNFSPVYDANTASTDLGVPIRLKTSIDETFPRSTVKQTYDQIFSDLKLASQLLDANLPNARSRPSKVAAHALFARIYLNRREYSKAEAYADSCLALYDKLIDYNTLSKTSTTPFVLNHDESIYVKIAALEIEYANSGNNVYTQISDAQLNLYEPNDLRLVIYFANKPDGTSDAKRGYAGLGNYPFIGLATDEVYLIKAECAARNGDLQVAMDKLNQLKIKRWNAKATNPEKPYVQITATDKADALAKVLLERRKELVWRSLRWDDLKRLNKEGANVTLTRTVNGQTYTLPPNSPRYVFPIPDNEIGASGIQQNSR